MSSEHVDAWVALGGILQSDATLTAMLADGASSVVYGDLSSVDVEASSPLVRLMIVGEQPDLQLSAVGRYFTRLQIDVIADNEATCWPILRRIEDLIEIPRKRRDPIGGAEYGSIVSLRRINAVPIKLQEVSGGGARMIQLASDWDATIIRTTT